MIVIMQVLFIKSIVTQASCRDQREKPKRWLKNYCNGVSGNFKLDSGIDANI